MTTKMKKKPIIRIEVRDWNSRTKLQQDRALDWICDLLADLDNYRKRGIDKGFWGESN